MSIASDATPEASRASGSKSPTAGLLRTWNRLQGRPGGGFLFRIFIKLFVPYTGTIRPRVIALEPGYAKASFRDRRRVRNHLRSVHAIALANLGELATGLAVATGLPDDARGIPTNLSIEYHKKARGTITAECRCEVERSNVERDVHAEAALTDPSGDRVATVTARWRIGPVRPA